MKFEDIGLSPSITSSLSAIDIETPRPIQQRVIPAALERKSLLVHAQTGSGKTFAYLLPLLEMLSRGGATSDGIQALVLAPTRELAQQIGAVCSSLGSENFVVIVGGVEYAPQREALAEIPQIVIATPGRFIDLLEQGAVPKCSVEYFVLDEVDQMVDLGFREPIEQLSKLRSPEAQTLCFSATLPEGVTQLVDRLAANIETIRIEDETLSVERIEQLGYFVSLEMMDRLLIHLLRVEAPSQAIVFTRSRKMADRLVGVLAENSIVAEAMHSDRSQKAREHILERFRSGENLVVVATDVIARGIDIESVTHVFNFGLPLSAEQYIHRTGRTGRAGRSGRAISLITPDEKPMLDEICRLMKRHVVIDNNHPYMTPDVTRVLTSQVETKTKAKKGKKPRR